MQPRTSLPASSISSHETVFQSDGSITFPTLGDPDYSGTWSQPTPDSLEFEYTYMGSPTAEFSGFGVGGSCWEGIVTFPTSTTYISVYEVCPF